ncbi:hypothetical protein [Clostridium sp.]|uniref:hypothetical protein n=1 Tax=Clostridium sp. TaxID=1506 RepID=UPI001E032AF4|nr:hypothetical protein [Clostridium sp.]MBS5307668.1 hypothetical protein [Clostridium sp.]
MFKKLPEYMQEVICSTSKNSVSREGFELYKKELEIIREVKKIFWNEFKEVIENDKPTSIDKSYNKEEN